MSAAERPPLAVRELKAGMRMALDPDWRELGEWVSITLGRLFRTDDHREGDAERRDLTGQHCVTIDDDDTRDIDDGLALERRPDGSLRLWIHVADPGRLVEVDSPLDLEARRRGSSLYLASGNLPDRKSTRLNSSHRT